MRQRILTVEQTKSLKVREVPLSEFALEWLSERAGLQWVGFHDLRRYRATQRVRHGVDLRTVQQLLGMPTFRRP